MQTFAEGLLEICEKLLPRGLTAGLASEYEIKLFITPVLYRITLLIDDNRDYRKIKLNREKVSPIYTIKNPIMFQFILT